MTAIGPVTSAVPSTGVAALSTIVGFLDDVAAPRPDPGGGAASALVLATGVALAEMVTGYSPDLTATEPGLSARLAALRTDALALVDADAAASAGFAEALAMPAQTHERTRAVVAACLAAAESALRIADGATRLLTELRLLDRHGEPRVRPDVQVAAACAGTAVRASIANVHACLELARTSGATAGDLLHAMRRLADLPDHLAVADSLAAPTAR
jgi:methenyltetrahydrofolate cyclohydrolase